MILDNTSDITMRQFLKCFHKYTEWVDIKIVNDEFTEYRNIPQYLSRDLFHGIDYGEQEIERLVKYYGDVPVWNVHADIESAGRNYRDMHNGNFFTPIICGNVHFSDIKDAWFREKEDKKRNRDRQYRKMKKERQVKQNAERSEMDTIK